MAVIQLKAALLIIGIAAGRKLLSRFFSPGILEWLWLLPAVRLLLPRQIGIPIVTVRYHRDFAVSLPSGFKWIRWIGFGVLLISILINCIRFYRGLRVKKYLQSNDLNCWIQAHPCRLRYRIYISDFITSPIVYGLFFPKIVLPSYNYSFVQYEYILLHEWMHIRRWDLWKKALMMLTALLNWYNPACWLMLLLFSRDIELACDADLLCKLQTEEHAVYASVLLDCYTRMNPSVLETGFLSGILQERIGAIMKQKKITLKTKCRAALLFGVLFLTAFGKISGQTKTDVPNLIGKTSPEAEQILQEAGYQFTSEKNR